MGHSTTRLSLFVLLLFTSFYACSQHILPIGVVLRVVIIRHAEKPDTGDNLSCAGLNRALKLPTVLDTVTGTPDYTYVPSISTGKNTGSVRMFQTVTPFAVQKNLTINSKHAETDSVGVAEAIREKAGVVLMVWEHKNIPPLARNLGIKDAPGWDGSDFDSIWIIDYITRDSKGISKLPSLKIEQEHITPVPNCPTQ